MIELSQLTSIPFLACVPDDELLEWARVGEARTARRRETLFEPGDAADQLILLRSGLVVLCVEAAVGATRMTAIVDPQQCLNICCLHPNTRQTMSGVALTEAEFICIPAGAARDALERGGTLARLLGGYCAAWATYLADEFIRATTQDVRTRAAAAMLKLMDTLKSAEIPLSQEQIAGLIGTRRETLALTPGEMRRQKILDTRYRRIKILNRQALLDDTRDTYPTCIRDAVAVPITGRGVFEASRDGRT